MYYLEELLACLYKYITGNETIDNNIIRKHTKKLEKLGEISFPLDLSVWCSASTHGTSKHVRQEDKSFDHLSIQALPTTLVNKSKLWPLHVSKCAIIGSNIHIHLERSDTFSKVLEQIMSEKDQYGSCDLNVVPNIFIKTEGASANLSELRMSLLESVIKNLLQFCGTKVANNETDTCTTILLTCKSTLEHPNVILCGAVLNIEGTKDQNTKAEDIYNKRTIQMRLLAEHKYGVRVTSQTGWKEFFEKLGRAAVVIEMLQNKPKNTVKINIEDHTLSNNKGASFILYNCARLSALFKEFNKKVSSNIYPPAPDIELVDFSLLDQPEEWELLFVYILQFPGTIRSTVKDILNNQISPHYLITMLSAMCSTFSVYYRRIKILIEPREHLFSTLFARIYLLRGVEQVLHNSLRLLNIEPVKQM